MEDIMRQSLILLMVTLIFSLGFTQTEEKCNLKVTISGFENDQGQALLALVNSEETFESEIPADERIVLGIENRIATFEIKNLVYGEYAIKVFHDEDQDGELDSNFFGKPTEAYGFSNNARGTFGPPDYEEAKFLISQKELEMTIIVK